MAREAQREPGCGAAALACERILGTGGHRLPRDFTTEFSAGSHCGERVVESTIRARSRSRGSMSLPYYASRGPVWFLLHYVCRRSASHLVVLLAVLAAVGCA